MKTRVQKWGNSLALRIPKSFATEAGIAEGSQVELSVVDGSLVIRMSKQHEPTLDELVRGITKENRHARVDFGPAVGKEIW